MVNVYTLRREGEWHILAMCTSLDDAKAQYAIQHNCDDGPDCSCNNDTNWEEKSINDQMWWINGDYYIVGYWI